MTKSKIEWTDYTINPIKGRCPNSDCPLGEKCYARAMYKRFKWNTELRYEIGWESEIDKIKKPSKIFLGSTMELFSNFPSTGIMPDILKQVQKYPQHTFIFLTKKPENLIKYSPFPDNCWVGVSACNWDMAFDALWNLQDVKASVKFLSIEPLLNWVSHRELEGWFRKAEISWLILGQQTPIRKATMPKLEWIEEIIKAADNAGVPVFLKDNLRGILPTTPLFISKTLPDWATFRELRQEFPKVEAKHG